MAIVSVPPNSRALEKIANRILGSGFGNLLNKDCTNKFYFIFFRIIYVSGPCIAFFMGFRVSQRVR